nr:GAF domain-containing protein [Kofleriaceae bacterium]
MSLVGDTLDATCRFVSAGEPAPYDPNAAASVHVPVVADGDPLGELVITRTEPLTAAERRFVDGAAALAAQSLADRFAVRAARAQMARAALLHELTDELARMTGDYRGMLDVLARRLGEVIGEACVIRVLRADGRGFEQEAAVYHRDPELQAFHRESLRRYPELAEEGLAARVLAARQTIRVPIVRTEELMSTTVPHKLELMRRLALTSVVGTPILAHGVPIAIAMITRSTPGKPYTGDDAHLLEEVAAHASIAITNARALDDRRRAADRLRVLSEASTEFASATGEPTRLLEMVARRVSEMVGELCAIRLASSEGLDANGVAYHPDPARLAYARRALATPLARDVGIGGKVFATGEAIRISADTPEELAELSAPPFRDALLHQSITAMMALPLKARGRVIGVMTLTRSAGSPAYTDDDQLFAQDLATHATLAIKNSRLLMTTQRTEEQLRQAQKMEAVGRLAGGVAHDFNNLLSVVLTYTTFLLEETRPGDPMFDDLVQIEKAGQRAADLTRQLLLFSRQQIVAPKVLDLNAVVRDMDRMLRRLVGEDIAVRTSLGAALGLIKADPGHIEQVMMNLVVNARDAMPNGGSLTIETGNVDIDGAFADTHLDMSPGPHVMLAISDTGIGMDADTRSRIFEPFFTTKEHGKGTGLGLSTVFGTIQQSGGAIDVRSQPGEGTTFEIYLPRVEAPGAAERPRLEPLPHRGSETILLVEDEEAVRTMVKTVLQRRGYCVITAGDGESAIDASEEYSGPIHLLLTDVVMPRMHGPDLARELALSRPEMRVLFVSGYTDDSVLRHGIEEGGVHFLQKPITAGVLTTRIRELLDAPDNRASAIFPSAPGR